MKSHLSWHLLIICLVSECWLTLQKISFLFSEFCSRCLGGDTPNWRLDHRATSWCPHQRNKKRYWMVRVRTPERAQLFYIPKSAVLTGGRNEAIKYVLAHLTFWVVLCCHKPVSSLAHYFDANTIDEFNTKSVVSTAIFCICLFSSGLKVLFS